MYIYKQPYVDTYMYVYMTGHIALSWGGIVEEEDITPMYIHIHLYVYVYTQVYILICIYTCKPIIYIFVYMTGHLGFFVAGHCRGRGYHPVGCCSWHRCAWEIENEFYFSQRARACVCMSVGERQSKIGRDRQIDRQTETGRERKRQSHRQTERDRPTDTHTDGSRKKRAHNHSLTRTNTQLTYTQADNTHFWRTTGPRWKQCARTCRPFICKRPTRTWNISLSTPSQVIFPPWRWLLRIFSRLVLGLVAFGLH